MKLIFLAPLVVAVLLTSCRSRDKSIKQVFRDPEFVFFNSSLLVQLCEDTPQDSFVRAYKQEMQSVSMQGVIIFLRKCPQLREPILRNDSLLAHEKYGDEVKVLIAVSVGDTMRLRAFPCSTAFCLDEKKRVFNAAPASL